MICCIMVIIQPQTILLEGGYGGPPQKIFIRISTKPCNSGGYTSLVIMPQKETANFEIDWYIETYNIHKYM